MRKAVRVGLVLSLVLISAPRKGAEVFLSLGETSHEGVKRIIVTATCYMPIASQCDSTPSVTASGKHIDLANPIKHRWIAISRDLLKKYFRFGDTVEISGTGIYDGRWVVNDVMPSRHKNKIDFLIGEQNTCRTWHRVKIIVNN